MTPDEIDKRNTLLWGVSVGRLKVADAEAIASNEGLRPLNPEPPDLDPMIELAWTLPMAVAWIAWRTPERVRDVWDKHRAQRHWWREVTSIGVGGKIEKGSIRVQYERATLGTVGMIARAYPPEGPAQEAQDALWRALAEGQLAASATRPGSDEPLVIPASDWRRLKPGQILSGPEVLRREHGPTVFEDIQIEPGRVIAIWAPLNSEGVAAHRKRGRRPKYAWADFIAEARSKLEFEGGISPADDAEFNQAALERHMATWCSRWTSEPGETAIREHVVQAMTEFVEGRKSRE